MARRTRILNSLPLLLALWSLGACVIQQELAGRPTAPPVIRITPAPPQDVPATATAFAQQVVPTPTPAGLYIVKPGDTLTKIADDHATTIDEIMALNNLSDPDTIHVGQELIIPSPAATPEAGPDATAPPETAPDAAATVEAAPEPPAEPAPEASPEVTPEN